MPLIQTSQPSPHNPRRDRPRVRIAARQVLRTGLGALILATGVGKMLGILGFA